MALAAASNRWHKRADGKRSRIVKNAAQVYHLGFGALEAATGHLIALTAVLTNKFAGVIVESKLGNGTDKINTYTCGEFEFSKSGSIDQTNIGEPVCGSDDDTVVRSLGVYNSPTGVANSGFVLTSLKPGYKIGFSLTEEAASLGAAKVFVSGAGDSWHIKVRAKTTAGSVQDNTTTEILAAIAANTQAAALVSGANAAGHNGSGKPAAIDYGELALPGLLVGKLTEIRGSKVGVSIDGYAA